MITKEEYTLELMKSMMTHAENLGETDEETLRAIVKQATEICLVCADEVLKTVYHTEEV